MASDAVIALITVTESNERKLFCEEFKFSVQNDQICRRGVNPYQITKSVLQ